MINVGTTVKVPDKMACLSTIRVVALSALMSLSAACSNGQAKGAGVSAAEQADVLLGRADPETSTRVISDQIERAQALVVKCMESRGFVYIASAPETLFSLGPAGSMAPKEFVSTYGFGILTLSGPNAPVVGDAAEDQNLDIVDALSPAGQDAWGAAEQACVVEADKATSLLGATEASQKIIADFHDLVAADPRVVAAAGTWSGCMSASGFLYTSPSQMRSSLQRTSAPIIAAGGWARSSEYHSEYSAQVQSEIKTASANLTCEEAYLSVEDEVVADLRDELIGELVDG